MGKTDRANDETLATRNAQRDRRDAERAADWNRDAKRFDAWTAERTSYDDELNAFVSRTVRRN